MILSSSGWPGLPKLMSLISWPTSGAGAVAFAGENPKSPSREYSAAPCRTGPRANESGTKSIPVNEESAASMASGDVIGCGGDASTSLTGRSSLRILARLADEHPLGGFVAGAQKATPGPPLGGETPPPERGKAKPPPPPRHSPWPPPF